MNAEKYILMFGVRGRWLFSNLVTYFVTLSVSFLQGGKALMIFPETIVFIEILLGFVVTTMSVWDDNKCITIIGNLF